MSAVRELGNQVSLGSLAKDYLEEYDGDIVAARNALYDELDNNKFLLSLVAEQAIAEAVRNYVSLAHRRERSAIITSIAPRKLNIAAAVDDLKETHRRMILDFPLAGGVKLREATKEQVVSQAEMYRKTEKNAARNRIWLEKIANVLKPGQIVGNFITEAKATKLFEESKI